MKEVAKDDVLGFVDRGGFSTIACHPEKTLESNYSLNTVDICPVGALTSTDFRFKMRVWFLKETKTIDVNDGLGCNITIGSRENRIYRITPRENNDVNGVWLPDSHRLNYKYLADETRIIQPWVGGKPASWSEALTTASQELKNTSGKLALIASAKLTNEELYLARRLATVLGITFVDVVPRIGEPDGILIPEDRNPNTSGARLLGLTAKETVQNLQSIVSGIKNGTIKGVISLGEDLTAIGLTVSDLKQLQTLIVTAILPDGTTPHATVLLPGAAWAEKRGSMINIKGRLQRLNRAVETPGEVRDDWEILRDLLVQTGTPVALPAIEDVFRSMAQDIEEFAGLNLSKIGDLGIQLLQKPELATTLAS
jgi:NADH-quinone oxidoreductase subunit G